MQEIPRDKLRNQNNVMLTSVLFWEVKKNKDRAVFSMADPPREGLISFRELYLKYAVEDPTEYTFAIQVLGSWEHWMKMQHNKELVKFIERCREERDIAIESKAVKEIVDEAQNGRNKFQAAKFLVQKGYAKNIEKGMARRKRRVSVESDIEDDLKRLMADG